MSSDPRAGDPSPSAGEARDGSYWKRVDTSRYGSTQTYEHRLPHGILVRVQSQLNDGISEAICFVPDPVFTLGPHR